MITAAGGGDSREQLVKCSGTSQLSLRNSGLLHSTFLGAVHKIRDRFSAPLPTEVTEIAASFFFVTVA